MYKRQDKKKGFDYIVRAAHQKLPAAMRLAAELRQKQLQDNTIASAEQKWGQILGYFSQIYPADDDDEIEPFYRNIFPFYPVPGPGTKGLYERLEKDIANSESKRKTLAVRCKKKLREVVDRDEDPFKWFEQDHDILDYTILLLEEDYP